MLYKQIDGLTKDQISVCQWTVDFTVTYFLAQRRVSVCASICVGHVPSRPTIERLTVAPTNKCLKTKEIRYSFSLRVLIRTNRIVRTINKRKLNYFTAVTKKQTVAISLQKWNKKKNFYIRILVFCTEYLYTTI